MFFTAPIWLVGLLPWAGVTLWLLWGRPKHEPVPFLLLWRADPAERPARRGFRPPPLPLATLLFAMLLALLSAARPAVRRSSVGEVIVLVDRGLTMSAKGRMRPRYVEAAAELAESLRAGSTRITVVDLLTGERKGSTAADLAKNVESWPRTAIDATLSARPAVLAELAELAGGGRVFLLSDLPISIDDLRFTQVFPKTPFQNVGIRSLAARESPSPQVMVAVRNDSSLSTVELRVSSGGREVTRWIDLPPAGAEAYYFTDFDHFGDDIEAALIVADDLADELDADNTARLARESRRPRLEIRSTIPDAVRRMAEVYTRANPSSDGGAVVALTNRPASLPGDAGVAIEPPGNSDPIAGEVVVRDDPVTALVDWSEALRKASAAPKSPEGWDPLVTVGGRVVVAKRAQPAKQIWVGFDAPTWPRSVDFVVFWTNALNWVGAEGRDFVGHPVGSLGAEWKRRGNPPPGVDPRAWPGLFERSDGALRAVNAPVPPPVAPPSAVAGTPATSKLAGPFEESREIGRWISLAAVVCGAVASLSWRKR